MSQEIVAKRYAKALFETAHEQNIVSDVQEQLKAIAYLLETEADFRKFLEHPKIDNEQKVAVFKNAFADKVSPIVLNTIQLLIARGRETIIPSLVQYYISIANEALNQASAIVYTPQALSEQESEKISKTFSDMTGKKIQVENVVDPKVLGGLRVLIGDRLYDGSLSNKLSNLQKVMNQKAL